MVFLKISQNSQENSFIKNETLAQMFSCQFCDIFRNTFFTEHLQGVASALFWVEMKMSTRQFLEFRLCVEAPDILSSIYFSSGTVRFWLVTANCDSFDLKYFCSDIFSPTVLLPRLHCFYHYFHKDNSKHFLLKKMFFFSQSLHHRRY